MYLYRFLSKEKTKDNNLKNYRLKLIFLALCILILLAIRKHITLGYVPELEQKSIAVAFDYYGAYEKEVEVLVSRIEEAYMELDGIKGINSVSESGRGYIFCQFSDTTNLDEAYVQISDITAFVWSDFPEGVNRPVITKSSNDDYPIYISYFPLEMRPHADSIRGAYEAVPGVGEVMTGSRDKKELMVELHTDRLSGMALSSQGLDSKLRSSNLARKVAMPGGQTLILSSRLSSISEFGQVQVAPDLRLSDVAELKYADAKSQNIGHIDGQPALLFFIRKTGEGNTVQLCRQLKNVTSHLGGSQFYSLGDKIEKSFIFSSLIFFLLFIFLLSDLWFKTKKFHVVLQVACRYIFSLFVAIASVTLAGFQVDMTVMAALSLVIFFCFVNDCEHKRQINYCSYVQENISDAELKKIINNIKPSEESMAYKKKYYDDVPKKYAVREFITSDGEKFSINTPIKRKPKQHEIDETYYLQKKGFKVEFLDEPKDGFSHPDLLINGTIVVEIKQIIGNAYTASNHIVEAMNKQGADVPVIFFMEKAVYLKMKKY